MPNKIIEVGLDNISTVLLDVSGVTATPNDVLVTKKFVNSEGSLVDGTLGGVGVFKTQDAPKTNQFRYRIIPNAVEYPFFYNGGVAVPYNKVIPALKVYKYDYETQQNLETGEYITTSSNSLEDFKSKILKYYPAPVYDNEIGGWVVGTLALGEFDISEVHTLGIEISDLAVYQQVLKEVINKFSKFVMPSKYALSEIVVDDGKVLTQYNSEHSNGVGVSVEEGGPIWTKKSVNDLTYKLLGLIGKHIKLVLPTLRYEMNKFLVKNDVLRENATATSLTNLINALAQLRDGNHIDTSTMMTSANTPEVIEGRTQLETLEKYMSSIFKTETHSEDEYTSAFSHFDDLFNEMVSQVAYACLIPN